jgi:hypothetical protein
MTGLRSQFSSFGATGSGGHYPDPFLDVASMASALHWAEYVYSMFGTYRIMNTSDDESAKWEAFLNDTLDIKTVIQNNFRNKQCYGNSFSSVIKPFKRFLSCPRCGYTSPLNIVHEYHDFNFKFNFGDPDNAFQATCPACKYRGAWRVKDEDVNNEKEVKVKIWNPHEIQILHDPFTDDADYLWKIPEEYKRTVRQSSSPKGNLFILERIPIDVLRAIANNQMFRFDRGALFHMKEQTLAGIYNRGWGIPLASKLAETRAKVSKDDNQRDKK